MSTPLFGVEEYIDIAFGYDVSVLEAQDDWHYHGNSPFCMDDFKDRKAPILAIDVIGEEKTLFIGVNKEGVYGIFMGDRFEDILREALGGVVMSR